MIIRARYLLAMGLVPSVGMLACSRDPAPSPSHGTTTRPQGSASEGARDDASGAAVSPTSEPAPPVAPTASVQPAEPTLIRGEPKEGRWAVTLVSPRPDPNPGVAPHPTAGGSCPGGNYCMLAPSAPEAPAAAPFASCESSDSAQLHAYLNPSLTLLERKQTPDACCYSWSMPCPGGRPLHDGDQLVLAQAIARHGWSEPSSIDISAIAPATRAHLAAHWREQAAMEHASVASFNRFALQLSALGASSELLLAAVDAARDEIEHARACYGLAARLDGEHQGPGPLPIGAASVATDAVTVASETLRDGCLGETVAAELVRGAAARAHDPVLTATLQRVANDETRHAELAWQTLAWLLREHGEPVYTAIAQLTEQLEARANSAWPSAHDDPTLNPHGVLSAQQQQRIEHQVLREVVLPCLHALLESAPVARHEQAVAS